jgi:hypothetical protein
MRKIRDSEKSGIYNFRMDGLFVCSKNLIKKQRKEMTFTSTVKTP